MNFRSDFSNILLTRVTCANLITQKDLIPSDSFKICPIGTIKEHFWINFRPTLGK